MPFHSKVDNGLSVPALTFLAFLTAFLLVLGIFLSALGVLVRSAENTMRPYLVLHPVGYPSYYPTHNGYTAVCDTPDCHMVHIVKGQVEMFGETLFVSAQDADRYAELTLYVKDASPKDAEVTLYVKDASSKDEGHPFYVQNGNGWDVWIPTQGVCFQHGHEVPMTACDRN